MGNWFPKFPESIGLETSEAFCPLTGLHFLAEKKYYTTRLSLKIITSDLNSGGA
jgi:hypothetical protein